MASPTKLSDKNEKSSKSAVSLDIPKKVTISFDLDFVADPTFRVRALFLGVLVVLFLFAGYLFVRSNFHLADAFDVPRVAYNIQKLYSVSFLLFLLLYGLALSLAIYYGFKQKKVPLVLGGVLLFVASLILGAMFPTRLLAFFILGGVLFFAALLSARRDAFNLSTSWSVAGTSLTFFLIFAFLLIAATVQGNRDAYFNQGLTQFATFAGPTLGNGVTGACAGLIQGLQISDDNIRAALPRDQFASYYATQNTNASPTQIDAAYNQTIQLTLLAASQLKGSIVTALQNATLVTPQQAGAAINPQSLATIRSALAGVPGGQAIYDYFGFFVALLLAPLLYAVKLVLQLVASLGDALLAKL